MLGQVPMSWLCLKNHEEIGYLRNIFNGQCGRLSDTQVYILGQIFWKPGSRFWHWDILKIFSQYKVFLVPLFGKLMVCKTKVYLSVKA